MIILKNLTQLEAPIARAKKLHPRIFLLQFGIYEVTGSKGDVYQVVCKLDGLRQKICFCSCEDKFPRPANSACYHIAAVVGLHIYLANCRIGYFGKDSEDHQDAIEWCAVNY